MHSCSRSAHSLLPPAAAASGPAAACHIVRSVDRPHACTHVTRHPDCKRKPARPLFHLLTDPSTPPQPGCLPPRPHRQAAAQASECGDTQQGMAHARSQTGPCEDGGGQQPQLLPAGTVAAASAAATSASAPPQQCRCLVSCPAALAHPRERVLLQARQQAVASATRSSSTVRRSGARYDR